LKVVVLMRLMMMVGKWMMGEDVEMMQRKRHAANHTEEVYVANLQYWVRWFSLSAKRSGGGAEQWWRGDASIEEDSVRCFWRGGR
jgi:hypothetical protein